MIASSIGPRVLIAGNTPGFADMIWGVLDSAHYTVLRTPHCSDVVDSTFELHPDAVVIEAQARDEAVLDSCRVLRDDPRFGPQPIILLARSIFRRREMVSALGAGAWHVCQPPPDPEEVLLCVERYSRAHRQAARAAAAGLVDPETGFYNRVGLARRSRELGSEAMRRHTALACVVLAADVDTLALTGPDTAARCGQLLKTVGRPSDVIGSLGPLEYVVLAPSTNAVGAAQLARRFAQVLRGAIAQALPPQSLVRVRAGFTAVPNLAYAPQEPTEILARAIGALRINQPTADFDWLTQAELEGRGQIS